MINTQAIGNITEMTSQYVHVLSLTTLFVFKTKD